MGPLLLLFAAETIEPPADEPLVSFSARAGWYDCTGAGLRVGPPAFGIAVTGGYFPILVSYTTGIYGTDPHLAFFSSVQLNASPEVRIVRTSHGTDIGLNAGYKYNTLLGHGAGAALYARFPLSPEYGIEVLGGPVVFPAGKDRVAEKIATPGAVISAFGPVIQGGLEIAIVWSP
jgi:hypothetical protein